MEINNLTFGDLPAQLQAWVTTRAFRRVIPFLKATYISLEGGFSEIAKGAGRTILQTELFAYNPRSPLDDSWFQDYCSHLCELDNKHYRVECFTAIVHALRKLKPRYKTGPFGAGYVSGDFTDSLNNCLEAIRALDRHGGVKPHEPPKLAEDWVLHLESDINHFTEITESLDGETDLLRKLTLTEMELIFCYLPDCFAEQDERDTEYQRPLFASNSFMQEVLARR